MKLTGIILSLCIVLIAGCGQGGAGGADGTVPANAGQSSGAAGLPAQDRTTYNISLDIRSTEYAAREVGGFIVELEVPVGIEPEVLPSDKPGIYQVASPIVLNPECLPPQSLTMAAWLPASQTLRLAVISAYNMKRFGRCVDIQLPIRAGIVTVPSALRTHLTEVVLYSNSVITEGDPGKLEVAQAVQLL